MLMRLILAPMMLALAGMATGARAQSCTDATIAPTSFADAAGVRDPDGCIMIEAVLVGGVLVADDRARYRMERLRGDPSSTGAVLGYYGERHFDQPMRVRVTGRLGDCRTAQNLAEQSAGPDAIVMMTGYCHYFAGRYVRAEHVDALGPVTFTRLLRADAGPDLGNLSPMAAGDTRRQMLAAAQQFAAAVRTGDRARIAVMHGGGPSGTRIGSEDAAALLLDDADSPFAPLRSAPPTAIEIFGWKPPLWADEAWHAARARTGTAEGIACFSVHRDAERLWPIDSKDADNLPSRPYACTRIVLSGTGADAPASFDTEQAEAGTAEPTTP